MSSGLTTAQEHYASATAPTSKYCLRVNLYMGMSWRPRVTSPVHMATACSPSRQGNLPLCVNPPSLMVPHGETTTLQAAVVQLFLGGICLDFSYPGPGVYPFCGIIPSDVCFRDSLPSSAHNASDRLFISSSAVAVDAAGGVPPEASATLTLN